MNHPYSKTYLGEAMDLVGGLFDIAVYGDARDLSDWIIRFFLPRLARPIEKGNPFVIAGKTSIENYEATMGYPVTGYVPGGDFGKSPEYWAGWTLAFCQWNGDRSFKELLDAMPIDELVSLYRPLHEADETLAFWVIERRILLKDSAVLGAMEKEIKKVRSVCENEARAFAAVRFAAMSLRLSERARKEIPELPWQNIQKASEGLVANGLDDKGKQAMETMAANAGSWANALSLAARWNSVRARQGEEDRGLGQEDEEIVRR